MPYRIISITVSYYVPISYYEYRIQKGDNMDFQQSRTFINLQSAFEDELKTSTLYEIYGDKARQEGYIEISNIFQITSGEEKIHALTWLRIIDGGEIPNTLQNLLDATDKESGTGNRTYREYSRVAREEGYNDIASLFDGVANIELNHELIFQTLADNIETNQVFCKPNEVLWICLSCGNILSGICAPEVCPVCSFPQGFYALYSTY